MIRPFLKRKIFKK